MLLVAAGGDVPPGAKRRAVGVARTAFPPAGWPATFALPVRRPELAVSRRGVVVLAPNEVVNRGSLLENLLGKEKVLYDHLLSPAARKLHQRVPALSSLLLVRVEGCSSERDPRSWPAEQGRGSSVSSVDLTKGLGGCETKVSGGAVLWVPGTLEGILSN